MIARAGRLVSALLVLLVLFSLCSCMPSQPDAAGWRSMARQSLEDVSGQVSSVRLTMDQERRHRMLGATPVVNAVYSEESAAKSTQGFTGKQPPPGYEKRYQRVSTALGDASDLLSRARIALAAEDRSAYPKLERRLDHTVKRLDRLRARLR